MNTTAALLLLSEDPRRGGAAGSADANIPVFTYDEFLATLAKSQRRIRDKVGGALIGLRPDAEPSADSNLIGIQADYGDPLIAVDSTLVAYSTWENDSDGSDGSDGANSLGDQSDQDAVIQIRGGAQDTDDDESSEPSQEGPDAQEELEDEDVPPEPPEQLLADESVAAVTGFSNDALIGEGTIDEAGIGEAGIGEAGIDEAGIGEVSIGESNIARRDNVADTAFDNIGVRGLDTDEMAHLIGDE